MCVIQQKYQWTKIWVWINFYFAGNMILTFHNLVLNITVQYECSSLPVLYHIRIISINFISHISPSTVPLHYCIPHSNVVQVISSYVGTIWAYLYALGTVYIIMNQYHIIWIRCQNLWYRQLYDDHVDHHRHMRYVCYYSTGVRTDWWLFIGIYTI